MRILILILSISAALHCGAQDCINPVDKNVFQEAFNQIAIQTNNVKKLEVALTFIKDKCLLSSQVKNLALLFSDDQPRLVFCKSAYARTVDISNFYDVYDAFINLSYALRLYDAINTATPLAQPPAQTPVEQILTFPKYTYPSSSKYIGVKGCDGPIVNEGAFRAAVNNAYAQPTEESKQLAILNAAEQNCFDFSQAMKLVSVLSTEESKLKVLTKIFPNIYDLESYKSGVQLFTNKNLQTEWLKYGSSYLTPQPPACEESEIEFQKKLKIVQNKFFDHERIKLMETWSLDYCFKVSQIKKMFAEITPASRKPDVLKKLFEKCPDKKNYYLLTDDLLFSSEKEELRAFIKSRGF